MAATSQSTPSYLERSRCAIAGRLAQAAKRAEARKKEAEAKREERKQAQIERRTAKGARKHEVNCAKEVAKRVELAQKELDALKAIARTKRARRVAEELRHWQADEAREEQQRLLAERDKRIRQREEQAEYRANLKFQVGGAHGSGEPKVRGRSRKETDRKGLAQSKRNVQDEARIGCAHFASPSEDGMAPTVSEGPGWKSARGTPIKDATEQRSKVREKLMKALGSQADEEGGSCSTRRCLTTVASDIEEALHGQLGLQKAYFNQARSIVYNLKDRSNYVFRRRVIDGSLESGMLPTMTAEGMASSTRNAERERVRQEGLAANTWRPDTQDITGMFTCEKCAGTTTTYAQSTATESCVRSGGEPVMTLVTFVTCLTCGYQWTERSGLAGD